MRIRHLFVALGVAVSLASAPAALALNPQPLPPGRTLNPQPLPPGRVAAIVVGIKSALGGHIAAQGRGLRR